MSYIFLSFQQIAFKLSNFTNLRALFPAKSIFCRICPGQKLANTVKRSIVQPRSNASLLPVPAEQKRRVGGNPGNEFVSRIQ